MTRYSQNGFAALCLLIEKNQYVVEYIIAYLTFNRASMTDFESCNAFVVEASRCRFGYVGITWSHDEEAGGQSEELYMEFGT